MDSLKIRKILIVQTAFIGDVILSTSVIENLHAINPDFQIDFLLRKGNEELLNNHPFLEKIYVWNKKQSKFKNLFKILQIVRRQNYDLIINLQRFASSGIFTILSGAKIKIGFDKNPFSFLYTYTSAHIISEKGREHEIDRNLSLLRLIDLPINVRRVKLYSSTADIEQVEQYKDSKYVLIAAASVWFTKQFPVEKWIEFLKEIKTEYRFIFIGAPSDYDLSQKIITSLDTDKCINLCGKLNLLQSMELMRAAERCFVNDSAPLHLASACNARTTAIFCSTVPEFGFGPLSDDQKIVQIKQNLSCRPCGLHGKKICPEKHFKCALEIDKQTIIETLGEIEHGS